MTSTPFFINSMSKPKVFIVTSQPKISKENKVEYANDKRIQELKNKGYNESNIRYMMGYNNFSTKRIRQGMKAGGVRTNGKV